MPGQDRGQRRVQVRDHDRQPAEVVRRPASTAWCGLSCSSTARNICCCGRVAGLDDVARAAAVGSAGRRSGAATMKARPPVPRPAQQGRGVEQHPVPGLRVADHGGVGRARGRGASRPWPPPVSARHTPRRPAQRGARSSTVPSRHCITRRRRRQPRRVASAARPRRSVGGSQFTPRPGGQDRAAAQPRPRLLYTRRPLPSPDPRGRAAVRAPRPPTRPSTGCSSATRTSCASWASRSSPRRSTSRLGRRGRLPDRPARVRAAGHRLRARRARGPGPGQPRLGARQPGRSRRQALRKLQGGRHRARR